MSQQAIYLAWTNGPGRVGSHLDIDGAYGDQCVDVDLSLGQAYFPGEAWSTLFPPTASAKNLGITHNDKYFEWIENDHNNPNQLPEQGDILVTGATPATGYTNLFQNPDGHTGPVESCNSSTYTLRQQDGSVPNASVQLVTVSWRYRPVLGWLRPRLAAAPAPAPAPVPSTSHTVWLPPTTGPWHLYPEGGPYTYTAAKALLYPSNFGGLTYDILNDRGGGIYTIQTQMFGRGDIYTRGSDVIVK